MPQQRYAFGFGIKDGKIFVLGGRTYKGKPVRESLVYDPKADVWSSVQSMNYERGRPQVVALGKELLVQGGIIEATGDRRSHDPLDTAEVYHAGKDEWRFLDLFELSRIAAMFTAQGKLYMTSRFSIYGHNRDSDGTHSWARLHIYRLEHGVIAIQAVNDELIGLLSCFDVREMEWATALCRSIGFGSKKEEVEWDTLGRLPLHYQIIFPIQL